MSAFVSCKRLYCDRHHIVHENERASSCLVTNVYAVARQSTWLFGQTPCISAVVPVVVLTLVHQLAAKLIDTSVAAFARVISAQTEIGFVTVLATHALMARS